MGRRVAPGVLPYVKALVVIAILAAPPILLALGVHAFGADAPSSCGGV